MELEVKLTLLKIFNSIFLILGLSVGGFGVWILFDKGSLLTILQSEDVRTVGAGLLFIGGVVLLVSVVGFVAANGYRFLLLLYMGFLLVLVLGQLFVTLLLLINRDKIERTLGETVDDIILRYGESGSSLDGLMDSIQEHGECCGRTGPSDWLRNSFIQSLNLTNPHVLPCSCFSSHRPGSGSPWCSELLNVTAPPSERGTTSYDRGCDMLLSDWLQENVLMIVCMAFGLVLIQVVQFIITVYLYRAFSRRAAFKRTTSLISSDHAHTGHAHLEDSTGQNSAYTES